MQESQAQAARRWGLWKLLGNSGSSISSLGPPGAGRPRAGDTSASFLAWTCPHGPTPPPPALSAAPRVTVPRALAEASGTRSPWTCVRVPLCFQAHLEDAIPHLVGSQEWPEGTPRSEQVSHGRERGPDGDGGNSRALKALYCGLRGGGGFLLAMRGAQDSGRRRWPRSMGQAGQGGHRRHVSLDPAFLWQEGCCPLPASSGPGCPLGHLVPSACISPAAMLAWGPQRLTMGG